MSISAWNLAKTSRRVGTYYTRRGTDKFRATIELKVWAASVAQSHTMLIMVLMAVGRGRGICGHGQSEDDGRFEELHGSKVV